MRCRLLCHAHIEPTRRCNLFVSHNDDKNYRHVHTHEETNFGIYPRCSVIRTSVFWGLWTVTSQWFTCTAPTHSPGERHLKRPKWVRNTWKHLCSLLSLRLIRAECSCVCVRAVLGYKSLRASRVIDGIGTRHATHTTHTNANVTDTRTRRGGERKHR